MSPFTAWYLAHLRQCRANCYELARKRLVQARVWHEKALASTPGTALHVHRMYSYVADLASALEWRNEARQYARLVDAEIEAAAARSEVSHAA